MTIRVTGDEATFLWSCALYNNDEECLLTDEQFDRLAHRLAKLYPDGLSPSFVERVPEDNLRCGSGLGLTFTEEELEAARLWRDNHRENTRPTSAP